MALTLKSAECPESTPQNTQSLLVLFPIWIAHRSQVLDTWRRSNFSRVSTSDLKRIESKLRLLNSVLDKDMVLEFNWFIKCLSLVFGVDNVLKESKNSEYTDNRWFITLNQQIVKDGVLVNIQRNQKMYSFARVHPKQEPQSTWNKKSTHEQYILNPRLTSKYGF